MKKLSILALSLSLFSIGCLKDTPGVDFSKVGTIVELPYSGLGYFSQDALNFTSDTLNVEFVVNIASTYPLNKDLSVSLSVDDAARTAYNASGLGIQYDPMPDSCYSFPVTSAVIAAGSRQATFTVTFYKSKIDASKSYLLPITLTDASGETISGNMATHYFHAIGNPIAGNYEQEWIRYNASDTSSGVPTYDFDLGTATFSPIDPNTISVESGSAGLVYIVHFDNNNGVLSNFTVSFDPASVAAAEAGDVIPTDPTIVVADPVNGIFRFYFTYDFLGNPRCITDQFIKQ